MNSINVMECGAITGASEMLALKNELTAVWETLRSEHPVDVFEAELVKDHLQKRIADAISTIPRIFEKRSVIFAGPDLIGLEAIAHLGLRAEVLVAVDQSLTGSVIERIANNIPPGIKARVTATLPEWPMHPTDSVLIALGLRGGYRFTLVPSWTASVVRRYATVYSGERVLIDPIGHSVNWRRSSLSTENLVSGWVTEMTDSLFTGVVDPIDPTTVAGISPLYRPASPELTKVLP